MYAHAASQTLVRYIAGFGLSRGGLDAVAIRSIELRLAWWPLLRHTYFVCSSMKQKLHVHYLLETDLNVLNSLGTRFIFDITLL